MNRALLCVLPFTMAFAQRGPLGPRLQPSIRYVAASAGIDLGDQINNAYSDLPESGGQIVVTVGGSFQSPIVFGTRDKPVLLVGLPGDIITLTYTGKGGVAMTFDYGTGHRMGHGIRDLTLTGPGNSTSTTGVIFGGLNGAEGIGFRDFKIQSFGTNLKMGSHTWLAYFEHGMIRDGSINLLLPSKLTEAGEQITFNHVTFADAPSPHTDNVWVQGNQEVIFTDCSFDQAQLRVGNGNTSGAQVTVRGTHFENPNYDWPECVNYDFVVVDNNPANYLRISDSYFLQDAPKNGPRRFMALNGGRVSLNQVGMFTPAGSPLLDFAVLANAVSVDVQGFYDMSGNISGPVFGGTTTGAVGPVTSSTPLTVIK